LVPGRYDSQYYTFGKKQSCLAGTTKNESPVLIRTGTLRGILSELRGTLSFPEIPPVPPFRQIPPDPPLSKGGQGGFDRGMPGNETRNIGHLFWQCL
jgi:hypothetical protein